MKTLLSTPAKIFWCFVVLILPALGFTQALNETDSSTGELIELRGQITDFNFRSPASSISLLVSESTGPTNWTIEAPSASQLRRLGWSSSSLFTGEIIRLQARQLPGVSQQAELVSLTRANGALLLAGAQQNDGHLDLSSIPTGLYRLDSEHAYITFSYDHQGFSRPQLRFDRFSASLNYDAENPENSDVRVEIDVSSLNSGVDSLDRELRSEEYFDTLNHPRISFRNTSIEMDAWGHAKVTGDIEIKGIEKPLTLNAQLNAAGFNPTTNMHTLGVSLTGTLNRSDWGMNQLIPMVSDQVKLQIEAEFVQPVAR